MPWVAACLDLLGAPLLGYCLAVRKLALQAGILQEGLANKMAPCAEEKRQGLFFMIY